MPLEIRRRGGRGGLRAHVHSAYSYSKNIVLQPFPVGQCVAFTNSDGHMFCERERRSRPNHHSQRTSPGAMTVLCRNSTFPADSYQQTDPHTSWPVPFSGKTRRSSQHSWNPPATKKSQNNRSVEPSPEPVPPPPVSHPSFYNRHYEDIHRSASRYCKRLHSACASCLPRRSCAFNHRQRAQFS